MNIEFSYFDKKLISSFDESPLSLAYGKMGFCLYFFIVSRMEKNKEYEKIANRLLDDIFEKAPTVTSIDVRSGLAGIGLGIHYLVKEKFVRGNINTVLADIDDMIFKQMTSPAYYETIDSLTLIHLLYYWSVRLKEQKAGSESQWLYQELIIHILNRLYDKVGTSFCEEPMNYNVDYQVPQFLFVLAELRALQFYNSRIQKIVEEFSYLLFGILPRLNAHRLYILWGLDAIKKADIKVDKLDNYIRIVRNEINPEEMFQSEFRNRNVFFNDGWISIYLLLNKLGDYFNEADITKYKKQIREKIEASDVWNLFSEEPSYFEVHKGLYSGYCGAALLKREVK
ncbi:hypothetical protein FACS189415_4520 [Bacteroidia bacterium]|nr:hypothetical protein FACS189415_4520 [Bacteroidia bacterium]